MQFNRSSLSMALCCLFGLAVTSESWGALTRISIVAESGTGMTSKAFSGSTQLASTGWAGSWDATIVDPQPIGSAVLPSPLVAGYNFTAFCTDIANSNPSGTYNYEALSFSSASVMTPEGTAPDPDWANSMSGQRAAWIYNTYVGDVNSKDTRAAMAIAIWEVLYEGSGTFDVRYRGTSDGADDTTGRTFASTGSSTVQDIANGWLDAGVAAGFLGYDYTWFAEREDPDVQSLVGPWAPIPEPTTVIAGALLVVPFLLSLVRRQRKNQAS